MRSILLFTLVACGGGPGSNGNTTAPGGLPSGTFTGSTSGTTWTGSGEWLRADDATGDGMLGGADLAIAPDGTMLVSWVDGRGANDDIRIARSDDGGASWSSSVAVDGSEEPIVDWWSGPGLVTDGTTVLLTSPARAGAGLQGFSWSAPLASLAFEPGVSWGSGLVEMISGALGPAGDVQVAWLQYGGGVDVRLATGSTGPDGVSLNGGLGSNSCECCPIDLLISSTGRTLASWRDNLDNVRNIAVASGPANQLPDTAVRATSTDWLIFSCPVQGGRLAELADGSFLLTWADASSGVFTVYVADSADGVSWSAERVVSATGGMQQSPRVVVGSSGTVYLTFSEQAAYALTSSSDGGQTWDAPTALVTDAGPVERADLASGAGQVWLEGEAAAAVWLQRLE